MNSEKPQSETGSSEAQEPRVLDLRGLWWLWCLVFIAMLAISLRLLLPAMQEGGLAVRQGTLSLADYGFSTDNSIIPLEQFTPSGLPRDGIRSLQDPPVVQGSEVPEINKRERRLYHRKFIVSGDRVVGVSINGEQRAYQINILNYHEIVNDTLGGVPIAVVYCPLTDSATVFSREMDGEILEFGSSGLLINSNIVMYDRRPELKRSSLWSQLQRRAVAGPMAGNGLELLPADLSHWGEWLAQYPDTTLLARETGEPRDYNSNPYLRYYEIGEPRFPVDPPPPLDGPETMERVFALQDAAGWKLVSFADVERLAGDDRVLELSGLSLQFIPYSSTLDPPAVIARDADGNCLTGISALWFAWHAMHPDAVLLDPSELASR
ncbi:DUF3179 domain-containing protein [bacterium]|nr:DUF3179 domain-containing protein [bacterium]